jgi:hypothetical protein
MAQRPTRRAFLATVAAVPLSPLSPDVGRSRGPGVSVSRPMMPPLSGRIIDPAHEIGEPLPPEIAGQDLPRRERDLGLPERAREDVGRGDFVSVGAINSSVPFRFKRYDFEISPRTRPPYSLTSPGPVEGWGVVDRFGVRVADLGGRLYDHPVGQAQYGINLVESYRITSDSRYIAKARMQAQRLIDRADGYTGGWFYPYPFRYALHGVYEIYEPPWYSHMAQGQALTLFCRLGRITGEEKFRGAADHTFLSYLVKAGNGHPWGVYVIDGLLWFEEYANPRAVRGDLTYNGHIFSGWGLWDYWLWTGDERARVMLQGALTTAVDVSPQIRSRQWRSRYCVLHGKDAGDYHTTHIGQHLINHGMTGHSSFAEIADLLAYDFPRQGVSGTIRFNSGGHTGYRFDSHGNVLAQKTIDLSSRSYAPSEERDKVMNRKGIWYRVAAGTLDGYRVRETPGRLYQLGECAALGYRVDRRGRAFVDHPRAYTIDSAGRMTSVTTDYHVGDTVAIDRRAYLNGVQHLRLPDGPRAGRWLGTSAARIPVRGHAREDTTSAG